ncbi:hypothetical protein BJF78_13380 [Pseudonocardia sp. CNS-139]|nr:hypothetical protein BJF78_13380 [Pseudonocardia sp. CNS-139]
MSTGTPDGLARPAPTFRFSARDLVNVAIFGVVFIVVSYAIGMLGIISPLTWLVMVPVSIVVNGITYMLFLTRVKHAGMVTLFAGVVGLFYLLSANTVLSTVLILLLGVAAEVVLWAGRYRSKRAAVLSYAVFALGYLTPFLPLLLDRESYFSGPSWSGLGSEYVDAADRLLSAPVLGVLAAAVLLAGLLGGLLGSAILRRHFVRAGLA